MERLQQFAAALVAAALAVLCMIVGILGLTVWKPAQEVVASVTPSQPFVMTRDGVLPLFGQSVKVTASAAQDEEVALVVGTPADIMGWIGTSAYTEIIGVEGGLTMLKTAEHESASTQAAQSSQAAQSGAQDNAQSQATPPVDGAQSASGTADTAQSGGGVVNEIVSNDMWLREVSGKGSVSLDLKDVAAGQAIMAASESGNAAPTITLTWGVKKTNVLAVFAWVLSILFAAIAVFLAYRQWRVMNSRHERAERIAARESADITDTQAISLEEIADYAASAEQRDSDASGNEGRDAAEKAVDTDVRVEDAAMSENSASEGQPDADEYPADYSDKESHPDGEGEDSSVPLETTIDVFSSVPNDGWDQPDTPDDAGEEPSFEADELGGEPDPSGEHAPSHDEAAYLEEYADMVDSQVGEGHAADRDDHAGQGSEVSDDTADVPVVSKTAGSPPADEDEPRVLTIGRHAANGGPIEADPPETVPTDTGTIDLSSIRPGAAILPSRRALREARERGLERLVIDGREFDTGLLPVVTRQVDTSNGDEKVDEPAGEEDSSTNHDEDSSSSRPTGQAGGWSSLMSSWMKRGTHAKEEE